VGGLASIDLIRTVLQGGYLCWLPIATSTYPASIGVCVGGWARNVSSRPRSVDRGDQGRGPHDARRAQHVVVGDVADERGMQDLPIRLEAGAPLAAVICDPVPSAEWSELVAHVRCLLNQPQAPLRVAQLTRRPPKGHAAISVAPRVRTEQSDMDGHMGAAVDGARPAERSAMRDYIGGPASETPTISAGMRAGHYGAPITIRDGRRRCRGDGRAGEDRTPVPRSPGHARRRAPGSSCRPGQHR